MKRTNIDHTEILRKELQELEDTIKIPHSIQECSAALRYAKTQVKEIINRSFATRDSERDEQIA
jgi:hypothetical protein